ncbi:ferritin-like protein [Maioricimonas sp. JC845]|uniref:ferritin-like domain-containing protein n=1 Tax=Maioricimonas sp. JC845 TaxID=3232138 RepID=UPI0034586077
MTRPEDLSWRAWAIFLLHTGAEVEHALLVQYLYAGYSIRRDTPERNSWRRTLLQIAQEEMGHLLTVQNILQALGAPLNFEREDLPFRSRLYPFPFKLERATRISLARYVLAELPPEGVPDSVLPPDERKEIMLLANLGNEGEGINQVGLLYDTLRHALQQLPGNAFSPSNRYQSGTGDWQSRTSEDPSHLDGIKTVPVTDKASALAAIDVIAQQGEGSAGGDLTKSHFLRFLNLFRAFPRQNTQDPPTYPVPDSPNTTYPPDLSTILHPVTRRWALLFNHRYALLLGAAQHALSIPASADRQLLLRWVFEEMSDAACTLGSLFDKLVTLDMDVHTGRKAAAPFELPLSMNAPHRPDDWWALHLENIESSRQLIDLLQADGTDPLLEDLLNRDGRTPTDGRRKVIADHL